MALLTLDELNEKALKREEDKPQQILKYKDTVSLKNVASSLWYDNEVIGVFELTKDKLYDVKLRFFNCGWLDEYVIKNFNSRIFDYGLHHISYAMLSDNEEMIQRYAKLRYHKGANAELSMNEMVALGESPIWCNTIQCFLENNIEGVERNLNIIETKTLPRLPKKEEGLIDDYNLYKALLAEDKTKMEEILEKLVSPKIHKKRNDNPILNQYISLPALGYAKLAWRKGIKVEIENPLIPKALLPISPLGKYAIPYDFLKESKTISLVKKLLLRQESFPTTYYDDEVNLSFHCGESGGKENVILSLNKSQPLSDLIEKGSTTYQNLAKIGIDKLEYLESAERKYEYRYILYHSDTCKKDFLIIFNFKEYHGYYSCRVFGVLEVLI